MVWGSNSGNAEISSNFGDYSFHAIDREAAEKCMSGIINDGMDSLQVVIDFDFTITKFSDVRTGERLASSHGVVDESDMIPVDIRKKNRELRDYYYPIEIDPQLSEEEKIPSITEWYQKAHQNLIDCGCVTRDKLVHFTEESNIEFRDGLDEFLLLLSRHRVPVLIFSAGVGDVIKVLFLKHGFLTDNVHIISNMMEFDAEGNLVGFGDLIHVFNKCEESVKSNGYFKSLTGRHNVLLLGDSEHDAHMAEGAESRRVLKIGFLNDEVETRLPNFKKAFDLVLVKDPTFDEPISLLKRMIGKSKVS